MRLSRAPCSAVTRGVAGSARKVGQASVLGWWFALSLVGCSSFPLGANAEGVGSGVCDGKHGIGVVGGVSSTELREELGFDLVSQFEVFIGVNVLG